VNLNAIHKVYFIGIGGIGMSAIAHYFASNGKQVAGYDKTPSQVTKALEAKGIEIHFEDALDKIPISFFKKEETLIVYTPAIPENHVELNYFIEHNFTVLKRAEILGMITETTFCLAVAGTHGKTTTSSILGHIMAQVGATSFLGGIAENYNSNLILGDDNISVVEADEYDRSFFTVKSRHCVYNFYGCRSSRYLWRFRFIEHFFYRICSKSFANIDCSKRIAFKRDNLWD